MTPELQRSQLFKPAPTELEFVSQRASEIEEIALDYHAFGGKTIILDAQDPYPERQRVQSWRPQDLMRQLYRQLGLNEHRLLDLRFEHKLVQALLFERYSPGAAPLTFGFSAFLRNNQHLKKTELKRRLGDENLFLKAALGEQSGESGSVDQTQNVLDQVEPQIFDHFGTGLEKELYVIQARLRIDREYRVHSFGKRVIPDLTFLRYQRDQPSIREIETVNSFVETILQSLPVALTFGSLFGWDVAKTENGQYKIIEANPTGLHKFLNPGFHCSGYFHSAEAFARLLRFLQTDLNVRFSIKPFSLPGAGADFHWLVDQSFRLLLSIDEIRRAIPSTTSMKPMEWVDVRLPPAHNVLRWVTTEIEALARQH